MREGLRTSLLSIACVVAVSTGAYAAASVRNVGGAGTYSSAASAATSTTAARAGSLRATGGSVRTTPVSSATDSATGAMPATTTTVSRAASMPRLSIGKYVGAPKAISQQGHGNITEERISEIEREIQRLETEKQIVLKSTRYIDIIDNEVTLNTEHLIEDLDLENGSDGHEIELDADNDDGIKWRYVARAGEPENEWVLLVSWDALKSQINLEEINQYIDNSITRIKRELTADLDKKVDKEQGVRYAGQVLTVDATGHVTPGNIVYSTTEVDQFITNIGDDLDTKVDKYQGEGNEGKVLTVDATGHVSLGDSLDVSGKVDKYQGEAYEGHTMIVNDAGKLEVTDKALGQLAYKDQVTTEDIANKSVTRAKAADDIVGVLSWAEWWKTNSPGENALLSVDADGNQQWFYVVE